MENTRERLTALMEERGEDCLSLSKMLGRNAAYVQQFLKRGVPRKLQEDDRRTLAEFFGVDESELGGLPPEARGASAAVTMVRRMQLGASAGSGALDAGEQATGQFGFDPRWLRKLSTNPSKLSIIQVAGDSMEPTLADGDDIMVDEGDSATSLRDGIYVIRYDDTLLVKRLSVGPAGKLTVISDNPAYPSIDAKTRTVDVIGRVVWTGRRVR